MQRRPVGEAPPSAPASTHGHAADPRGDGDAEEGTCTPALQALAAAVGVLTAVVVLTFAANALRADGDQGEAEPDLIALAKRGNPWERFSRVPVATGRLPDVMRLESDTQHQPMGWLHNSSSIANEDPLKGAYTVFTLGELTVDKKGNHYLLPKPMVPKCMSCAKNGDLAIENQNWRDQRIDGFDQYGIPLAESEEAYARKKHAVKELFTPTAGPFVALVGSMEQPVQVKRPAIAVLGNGDTLLVASCGDPNDPKPLVQSRLVNGYDPETGRGARWSIWESLDGIGKQPDKYMHDYPALLVDGLRNHVHLFYTRWPAYNKNYDLRSRSVVMRSESRDYGETWSIAEVAIPAARGHRTSGPALISRLTGKWLLPLRRRDKDAQDEELNDSPAAEEKSKGEYSSVITRSGDNGLTWQDSTIAGGPGTPQRGFLMDPRVVAFDVPKPEDDGVFKFFGKRQAVYKERLVAFLQDDSDIRRVRAISSEDGGATWRDPLRTPLPSRHVSLPIAVCTESGEKDKSKKGLYVIFDNSPMEHKTGTVLSIAYSMDGGRSFPFVRDLDTSLLNSAGQMANANEDVWLKPFGARFGHPACASDEFGNVNIVYELTLGMPEWTCGNAKSRKKKSAKDLKNCLSGPRNKRTVIKWLRIRADWVKHMPGKDGAHFLTGIYRGDMLSSWIQNSERAREEAAKEMLGRVATKTFDADVELLRKKLRTFHMPPPPPSPPPSPPPPPPALPPFPGNYFGSTVSQAYHRAEMERLKKHQDGGAKMGSKDKNDAKWNAYYEQSTREKSGRGFDMGLDLMMGSSRFFPASQWEKLTETSDSAARRTAPGTNMETRGSMGFGKMNSGKHNRNVDLLEKHPGWSRAPEHMQMKRKKEKRKGKGRRLRL